MKAAPKPTAKAATQAKPVTAAKVAVTQGSAKPKTVPAAKLPAKEVVKAAAKTTAKTAAKPAAAPVAKTAAVKAVAKASTKTATKAAVVAPATKPAVKAAAPTPARKPAPAAAATKVAAQPAAKAEPAKAVQVKPAPVSAAPASRRPPSAAPSVRPGQEIAVVAVGKRAAKKAMMEQMAQAVSLPTHDPDAAKATFSISNERAMNTPVHTPVRKDPNLANNWLSKSVDQLSDDEILSMPDGEYMNDVQLAFFRLKLSRLKADMLANAGETTEHLREDTVVVPDPADRATIEEEHALELRTRDRERKLLKKIEQAIVRIDAGDYV